MATCADTAAFLEQVNVHSVTARPSADDLSSLQKFELLAVFDPAGRAALDQEVEQLEQARLALVQESAQRAASSGEVGVDTRKTHSILFHLEGVDEQHAALERLQQAQTTLQSLDADLVRRQQAFAQLLSKKAVRDQLTPCNGDFVALTTQGRMALRDLNVRLYRVGDEPFETYWDQAKSVDASLWSIANLSAQLEQPLSAALPEIDRAYLWAVGIGVVKAGGPTGLDAQLHLFLDAYRAIVPLSDNTENRLMAAEVLSALRSPLDRTVPWLQSLMTEAIDIGVAHEGALGVAAILLLGERADGTFATEPLAGFLTATASLESAALLAIVNRPYQELLDKFHAVKAIFAGWGYSASEDTELASAYLTASDLPADSLTTKVAILARGLSGYLQFPLVGAAILASIPVLEANETLNLLEKAYEILGQRTGPMSQAELISLAIRMIHGVDVRSVDELDPTARPSTSPPGFSYVGASPRIWMPVFITHHAYYSTFSGIGGPHPGHVHSWGGGGFG